MAFSFDPSQVSLIVDDSDPRVSYSLDQWTKAGSSNEFNATTSATTVEKASFTFKFNGTSVKVYGTVDNLAGPPKSSYIVDGSAPVPFTGPNVSLAYQQIFYRSPELPNGEHTLVGTCAGEGSRIFLDYLVVGSPLPSSSQATATVTSIVSGTRAVPAGSSSLSSSSHLSAGPIAGAAIGGAAFTLLLAFLIWVSQRKRSATLNMRTTRSLLGTAHGYTPSSASLPPLPPLPPVSHPLSWASLSGTTSQTFEISGASPPAYISDFGSTSPNSHSGTRKGSGHRYPANPSSNVSSFST